MSLINGASSDKSSPTKAQPLRIVRPLPEAAAADIAVPMQQQQQQQQFEDKENIGVAVVVIDDGTDAGNRKTSAAAAAAADDDEAEHHGDAAALIKSIAEPTRVKSPEQIINRSPDPVNWTVPLDTGRTFTVTQNIRGGK